MIEVLIAMSMLASTSQQAPAAANEAAPLKTYVSLQAFAPNETRFFPSAYYDSDLRQRLERRVLVSWPGPTGLLLLWNSNELGVNKRRTLLLGAGAFHDPQLLPMYLDAVTGDDPSLWAAAAYGYRLLLGDSPPAIHAGVTLEQYEALGREIQAMIDTLAVHSMAELWTASAVVADNGTLPGYGGIVLHRRSVDCLLTLEKFLQFEDLEIVIRGFRSANSISTRVSFMKLIEGLTLRRFLEPLGGVNIGWGPALYEEAIEEAEVWLLEWELRYCDFDYERVLAVSMREMGARASHPMSAGACEVWLRVIDKGDDSWWPMAARQLYGCGGPPAQMSILRAEREENRSTRDLLVQWYELREQHSIIRDRQRRAAERRAKKEAPNGS